jgi:DNA-directed RNA polymerase specialized sigma24 family protein
MRIALGVATTLVGLLFVSQLVIALTLVLWSGIVVGASYVAVKTGGLDIRAVDFGVRAAFAVSGGALLVACGSWVADRVRAVENRRGGLSHGHPFWWGSIMLGAAVFLTGLVSQTDSRPLDVAAIAAALACAYFLALCGPILFVRIAVWTLAGLYRVGARSQWLAGALTATFVLLAGVGALALRVEHAVVTTPSDEPVDEDDALYDEEGLPSPRSPPDSLSALHLAVLCETADLVAPDDARDARKTPGCATVFESSNEKTHGSGGPSDFTQCIESIFPEPFNEVTTKIQFKYDLPRHDANDAAAFAALATCQRVSGVGTVESYFRATAYNRAKRMKRVARRYVTCDLVPEEETAVDPDPLLDHELGRLWAKAKCTLPPKAWKIVQLRLVYDLSFEQIDRRLELPPGKARTAYYDALKKLRRERIGEEFDE